MELTKINPADGGAGRRRGPLRIFPRDRRQMLRFRRTLIAGGAAVVLTVIFWVAAENRMVRLNADGLSVFRLLDRQPDLLLDHPQRLQPALQGSQPHHGADPLEHLVGNGADVFSE